MKLSWVGRLLGIIQIMIAIWYFDWNSWDHIATSVVLLFSAIYLLFIDSGSSVVRKTSRFLFYLAAVISLVLLINIFD